MTRTKQAAPPTPPNGPLPPAPTARPHGHAGDDRLREAARQALLGGKIPARDAVGYWGGPGQGDACAICGEPVQVRELELELEFAPDPDGTPRGPYHLHIPCYAAWHSQRPAPADAGRNGAGLRTRASFANICAHERDSRAAEGPGE